MHNEKGARILVVDDEQDITLTLQMGLEKYGFQVVTFNDPLLALSNFKAGLYDLALLDIRMPKIDGFKLYEELQKIDGKVKICFMTAFEINYGALKELFPDSYSSICFVKKPFSMHEFVKKISKEIG